MFLHSSLIFVIPHGFSAKYKSISRTLTGDRVQDFCVAEIAKKSNQRNSHRKTFCRNVRKENEEWREEQGREKIGKVKKKVKGEHDVKCERRKRTKGSKIQIRER